MSEAVLPQPASGHSLWLDRPFLPSVQRLLASEIDRTRLAFAAIILLAFALRIADLGTRAMHHDESLHATYAWYLYKGDGYHYDPLMHGPLQFYVMAFFYLLFGDSETTARLFAVLCGTAIVFLPYLLRREMTLPGSLIAAIFLAVSPTFLYFSRFARDDIYLDCFTLVMVLAFFAYLRSRRTRSVFIFAAAAALAVASMEASYIFLFVMASFIGLAALLDWISRGTVGGSIRQALSCISLETWLLGIGIFVFITVVLYSTFLSNPYGLWDTRQSLLSADRKDILGGLTYWISQHGVARGGQPWFYYLLLLPLYEQFALLFGLAGALWALTRRHLFSSFLLYWAALSFVLYGWAGEKMPWLFLHPLLPLILLAASFCGRLLTLVRSSGRATIVAILAILAVMESHSALALSYADAANPTEMLIYVQTSNDVPTVARQVIALTSRLHGTTPMIQVDNADLQGWPFEWYFRNLPPQDVTYSADFSHPTAPILLMLGPEHDIYGAQLQSRYAVAQYRWNWWFPEDYKGFTFDDGRCGTAAQEVPCKPGQTGTVFLQTGSPCPPSGVAQSTTNCSPVQQFPAINLFKAVRSAATWRNLWSWFVFRRPFGLRGARLLYVYVRRDLLPKSQQGSAASQGSTTGPSVRRIGYRTMRVFGHAGSRPGQILNPRGIALGPNGRVYVADSGNHRIDIFSASGRFLRSIGRAGWGPEEFSPYESPMGVAVSKHGAIYVADFWNHRVEVLSWRGRLLRTWGRYGTSGSYGLFGPRSLVVGAHGDIYVADTGNRRIGVFSKDGKLLFHFGRSGARLGQFDEPSSIAIGHHSVYVTDMWNRRIQRFTAAGAFEQSWPVPSWQSGSYQEPYSAVLANGDVAATDPADGRILMYSPTGHLLGAVEGPDLIKPMGVAARGDVLYATDGTTNRVVAIKPLLGQAGRASTPAP